MILVTGANSIIGHPLLELLERNGKAFKAVSRQASTNPAFIRWNLEESLTRDTVQELQGITALIHCAPIWLLPQHIRVLEELGIKRAVVFSSTSVLGKKGTGNSHEQKVVEMLEQAESFLINKSNSTIPITILRPTLIYGYGLDKNVTKIASTINKWGIMAVVSDATGKRQPVHADDLASAALAALESDQAIDKIYNLGGGEVLTYYDMVARIFEQMQKQPRIIKLPQWLMRLALSVAARITRFDYTADMANRMMQDLVYSDLGAANDIAYTARKFYPTINDLQSRSNLPPQK